MVYNTQTYWVCSLCSQFGIVDTRKHKQNKQNKQTNKLHGLSPRANYPTERPPIVGEVIANFCG
jgi:hypothetical protein